MPDYPPPSENRMCQCWPNMMRAFFCATGHMTECHFPLDCLEAQCSHLPRYENPAQDDILPAEVLDYLGLELVRSDEQTFDQDGRPVHDHPPAPPLKGGKDLA